MQFNFINKIFWIAQYWQVHSARRETVIYKLNLSWIAAEYQIAHFAALLFVNMVGWSSFLLATSLPKTATRRHPCLSRQFKSGRPKQQNSAIQGWNWPFRLVCWHLLTSSEEEATPTNQNERPDGTSYIPSIAPFSYFGRPDLNCLAAIPHMKGGDTRPIR